MSKQQYVNKQIQNMVSFMEQEAAEKANEILIKAEEEFLQEKDRILQEEKTKIREHYDKRIKQVELQRKILYSNEVNQNRLRLLEVQNKYVNDVISEAKAELVKLFSDQEKYKSFLEKLILEGMLTLLEPTVTIQCRRCDVALAECALRAAEDEFSCVVSGRSCSGSVGSSYLPVACAGGILVCTPDGRITCDQTVDKRLNSISFDMMPRIREILFGSSKDFKPLS
ncbi:V-type proton ATPase subunit E 2-like [Zophobas morio]|uniref:V-type proton ATPase subunit E 2-like n=1 Tax=Zophobas morio TaxID=2755281 RepID=UPI0030837A7C